MDVYDYACDPDFGTYARSVTAMTVPVLVI